MGDGSVCHPRNHSFTGGDRRDLLCDDEGSDQWMDDDLYCSVYLSCDLYPGNGSLWNHRCLPGKKDQTDPDG